jgi:biotin carboxyl carrier protein
VNWFIGQNINARPTTRFIVPYLTAVGELKRLANNIDLVYAYDEVGKAELAAAPEGSRDALGETLERKYSLLRRPLQKLLQQPHMLSGWLSVNRDAYTMIGGRVSWNENPVELLADTYHFLNMDYREGQPAADMIWDHDNDLLQAATDFYDELNNRLQAGDWIELQTLLDEDQPAGDFDAALWAQVRSAHLGFQSGLDILGVLPWIAETSGYFELCVNDDLTINIPPRLVETDLQDQMAKLLAPPPVASSNEILAQSGGMFYSRETPEHETYVTEGSHFNQGDPLYIVEVMKMFNKVYAPFSGTIDEVQVGDDGVIISKGQPLFKITPDEVIVMESPEDVRARRRASSDAFLTQFH